MTFPSDYTERVYAGVLGKIIGVYLGRPFEGWTHEQIQASLGEITYYVNGRRDLPLRNHHLVVTDDDISGTFTFLRALADYDYAPGLTPAQIGQTWLNYIVENRTILWWGGLGNSTEHTAYLRLKDGVTAPHSGSMALNGQVVSEQIGAQIFIDGWGLVAPGDPGLAADLARRAASVSHDGEAIHGAQVIAGLVAGAFVESDLDRLLDTAVRLIPADSLIARLIADVRAWHAADPSDWRAARARLEAQYGYDKYGGNCHIVPNHGLVILSLLYGGGDFGRSQTIVNTSGWDTDCNAGNVGCILGVRGGLAAFPDGADWRGPVADRLYLPTADGGRAISDALREADAIVAAADRLHGLPWTPPKDGARFHFSQPGAVQGFEAGGGLRLENAAPPAQSAHRALALHYPASGDPLRALTPVFIPPEAIDLPGYALLASPALYPGQTVRAAVSADPANSAPVSVQLCLTSYGAGDRLDQSAGPAQEVPPGQSAQLEWTLPEPGGMPCAQIGLAVTSASAGTVYLEWLSWDGAPRVTFRRPDAPGELWKRQWCNAADILTDEFGEAFRVIQNRGRGLAITGAREWEDYTVQAVLTPHLARAFGLAARVQGQERYYALLIGSDGRARLVKRLDGERVLAEAACDWRLGRAYDLRLRVAGRQVSAWVDDALLFEVDDTDRPLLGGGIALAVEEGRVGTDRVVVTP